MANSNPPKKNQEFTFAVHLSDAADPRRLKSSPTIAAGDFKVSTDFGAFANLTTLPTVTPSGGVQVKVIVSATEMNGDNVSVTWQDQDGPEWVSGAMSINTTA